MASITDAEPAVDARFDVVVVGAGGCGLSAAMAARDAGASVAILDRDVVPTGDTSWSMGMVPAAGSYLQRAAGVDDDPALFEADLLKKTRGLTDRDVLRRLAQQSGPTLDWLTRTHGLDFVLLTEIVYPGHSRARYHVPRAAVTGEALHAMLTVGAKAAGATFLTGRAAEILHVAPSGRINAVSGSAADGAAWALGCGAVVVATNGFAANPERVRRHIPSMADAISFCHWGAQGDALAWAEALGAETDDLGAYQGHQQVQPEGLPLTWAVIIDGGVQVNASGRRFADEMRGYSEQAADILRQPQGLAWTIYGRAMEANAERLDAYRRLQASGALVRADDLDALAAATSLPRAALGETLDRVAAYARGEQGDPFGRDFTGSKPIAAPYVAARVTGALYHTQGGVSVDVDGRARRRGGGVFPNLFVGGGAGRGVSGPADWGYLGGNGLLSALVLGRLAGDRAARDVRAVPLTNPPPLAG